jgi:biopolymer transport protein ExbB/TolQ|tara:strand:- start:305 stop:553 length:249 start_codon:yes stop_codon:yes gene_type:complete
MSKKHLDNYIKICVSIISGSILIVILMFASLFTYVLFFESNETTQIERRQEHVENHIKEAKKLDDIIKVLEEISKNLDERKN